MRLNPTPTRASTLAAATTVVALMAVAASTVRAPAMVSEARQVLTPGHTGRVVAVALAAVARDLLNAERIVIGTTVPTWTSCVGPTPQMDATIAHDPPHVRLRPADRLLDLPPPAC